MKGGNCLARAGAARWTRARFGPVFVPFRTHFKRQPTDQLTLIWSIVQAGVDKPLSFPTCFTCHQLPSLQLRVRRYGADNKCWCIVIHWRSVSAAVTFPSCYARVYVGRVLPLSPSLVTATATATATSTLNRPFAQSRIQGQSHHGFQAQGICHGKLRQRGASGSI